ncbi:MAG: HEAT repeat domain-containing protein, partial [Bacteroidales bacterium]
MKIKFLMQRMKFIGAIMCVLFISGELQAKNWFSTFAVVVDGVTYSKIKTDVDAYVTSVQTLDRKGVLVIDKWNSPDSLRAVLNKMYKNNNLEGAVFIGDIPVPMIRDAHHLTTAFKMNPKRDWKDSSVPSDRFYDDFDLIMVNKSPFMVVHPTKSHSENTIANGVTDYIINQNEKVKIRFV